MNKASKAITLALVGSGAVLLGYTAFRPRTPSYYDYRSGTQPSSYHGSRGYGGAYFPYSSRHYRYGSGSSSSSGYRSTSSGSSGHYSGGASHNSGTSRGGFGSSGRSSVS
jgi:hypothetical protein